MNRLSMTRRQRESEKHLAIASQGFERGFEEGSRYLISLLMGLPRPSFVVLDDTLPSGTVGLIAHHSTEIQHDRLTKLGELLDAVGQSDARAAAAGLAESSPMRRLERVAAYVLARKAKSKGEREALDAVLTLLRGEPGAV
jgi:hypothetical protein